ncbi:MAG: GNAT family N-acetyltransferase [Rubrobacter sp.]|nr:GNAT family N-acetyltransferase [Rubrobacter sp.]
MQERDFEIRFGRREDATEAAGLWVQSAREHEEYDAVYTTSPNAERTMRRFLADLSSGGYACLLVAVIRREEGGEEMVGFLSAELREGSPAFSPKTWTSIDDVYVAPGHRGRGIGRSLLDGCKEWSREKGADGVSLQVAAANERARKLYRELGFREVSVYEVLEF